jgi:hypothetical protein
MVKGREGNGGVCDGNLHRNAVGARRIRRRGGAELLSAQGGDVVVLWECCGEEMREGRGLGAI